MSITLERRKLQLLERLMKQLVSGKNVPPVAHIVANDKGIPTLCASSAVGLLTIPLSHPPVVVEESIQLPWTLIKDLAARHGTASLDLTDQHIIVSWDENGLPRQRKMSRKEPKTIVLPPRPEKFITLTHQFFEAFVDATHCVDKDNEKYNLGGVSLQGGGSPPQEGESPFQEGKSRIVATDGRHLLIQKGFTFPWKTVVVCPTSSIFTSKEMREYGKEVNIGYADSWIWFEIGDIVFRLKEIEGKYPNVDNIIKGVEGQNRITLDPSDAAFVAQHLMNLPGNSDEFSPVYIKLGEKIGVCGHDKEQGTATELHLEKSCYEGKNIVVAMNRKYLKRALGLNFRQFQFDINVDPKTSKESGAMLLCSDDSYDYIWMPIDGAEPECSQDNITVLTASSVGRTTRTTVSAISTVVTEAPLPVPVVSTKPVTIDVKARSPERPSPADVGQSATVQPETEALSPRAGKRKPMKKSEFDTELSTMRTTLRTLEQGFKKLSREYKKSRIREQELRNREQKLNKRETEIAKGQTQIRQAAAALLGKL
jgi:DNA polymerase III sliding clamp (beta) subunit (PCNA family)